VPVTTVPEAGPAAGTPGRGDARLGFRRVSHVRVHVGGGCVRAEVVGVLHRLPVSVPVPLGVAARLVADGVPVVVLREGA
jgi:hypothetical protein